MRLRVQRRPHYIFMYDLQSVLTTTLVSTAIGNTIENNVPAGVEATTTQSFAGGIGVLFGTAVLENNIVRNNSAYGKRRGHQYRRKARAVGTAGPDVDRPKSHLRQQFLLRRRGPVVRDFFSPYNVGAVSDFVINNTIGNDNSLNANCPLDNPGEGNVDTYWITNQLAFINNIIYSTGAAPTLFCFNRGGASPSTVPMTIFDHNDVYSATGHTYSSGCGLEDFSFGNISADPQFVNPAAGDFHLKPGSPAIDAGNNSAALLALDLDGRSRTSGFFRQGVSCGGHGRLRARGNPGRLHYDPAAYPSQLPSRRRYDAVSQRPASIVRGDAYRFPHLL